MGRFRKFMGRFYGFMGHFRKFMGRFCNFMGHCEFSHPLNAHPENFYRPLWDFIDRFLNFIDRFPDFIDRFLNFTDRLPDFIDQYEKCHPPKKTALCNTAPPS